MRSCMYLFVHDWFLFYWCIFSLDLYDKMMCKSWRANKNECHFDGEQRLSWINEFDERFEMIFLLSIFLGIAKYNILHDCCQWARHLFSIRNLYANAKRRRKLKKIWQTAKKKLNVCWYIKPIGREEGILLMMCGVATVSVNTLTAIRSTVRDCFVCLHILYLIISHSFISVDSFSLSFAFIIFAHV